MTEIATSSFSTTTLASTVLATTLISGCLMAATVPTNTSQRSHHDGERFYNVPTKKHAGIGDALRWHLARNPGPWGEPRDDIEPGPPPPNRVGVGEARVTFVNHATVLVQMDAVNILTDPVYAAHVGPVSWIGVKRVRPPGIAFVDLPEIDVVLISHDHYDHLCLETLRRLHDRDQPLIVAGLGNGRLLSKNGISSNRELDWWQSVTLEGGVEVTFTPAQHSSNRGLFDRYETLWGSFFIKGSKHRVYFAGDTGEGPHFAEIRKRLGEPDAALLPIGAFRPKEIMQPVHLSPAEAVVAHQQLGARQSMAIHFGTFPLTDDGQYEAVELLSEAIREAGLTTADFWAPAFGEGRAIPPPVAAAATPVAGQAGP